MPILIKGCNFYCEENVDWKWDSKDSELWKLYFPSKHSLIEYAKIAKKYMLNFNATLLNGFKINGKYI